MKIGVLKKTDRRNAHQVVKDKGKNKGKNKGKLSDKNYKARKRGIDISEREDFSKVKNYIRWAFGLGASLFIVCSFGALIYFSFQYVNGLLTRDINEELGDFLSKVVTIAFSALSALFLKTSFR